MNLQFRLGDYVTFGAHFGFDFGYIEKIEHTNINLKFETIYDIRSTNNILFPGVNENYVCTAQTVHIGSGGTRQSILDALKTGDIQKVADSLPLGADPRTAIKQATYTLAIVGFISHVASPFGLIIGFSESNSQFEERVIDYIVAGIENINSIFINTATSDQLNKLAGNMQLNRHKTECVHSWKLYDSGWKKVTYCEHCNEEKI